MPHIEIKQIPAALLLEHPENSNFMNTRTAQKLRRHIEQTGRYEPLTVRPHPSEAGKFQVINGHNRLRILRAINVNEIYCIVWNLDDQQTRLYLATLNRLSGKDVPERRSILLDNLLQSFEIDDLILLLPDDSKQLEQLEQLAHFDQDETAHQDGAMKELTASVMLDFILDEKGAKELNLAIDLMVHQQEGEISRSQALVHIARYYLHNHAIPGA